MFKIITSFAWRLKKSYKSPQFDEYIRITTPIYIYNFPAVDMSGKLAVFLMVGAAG
jgi:hypothetical protein